MKHVETLDLSVLPKMAQIELRDFYSFLKNKYAFSETDAINTDKKQIDPIVSGIKINL